MTFPAVELKFSNLKRTNDATIFHVYLYRVDDGGIVDGLQQYSRTLLRDRVVNAPPFVTKTQVLANARQKLQDWATEEGFNLTPDRLICDI